MCVVGVRGDDDGHDLVDAKPVALQPGPFERVVGHQAHVADAQLADDAGPHAVVAFVGLEAQFEVGVHRVETLILQFVGVDFVAQPDAAPLLIEVDDGAPAFAVDHLHRLVELLAAVAAVRAEDVARGARRMHAHQHRIVFGPLPFRQGHMLHAVGFLAERCDLEFAPLRGQGHRHALFDDRLLAEAVGDQRGDRDDFQVEFFCGLQQLRQAGHRAVLVHNLDQRAGGLQSGQAGQVDGRLGVSRTAQHALVARAQGIDMSRAAQVGGFRFGVGQRADRRGAVVDRDARGAVVAQQVDRHGEGRAQQRGVVLLHHVEPQFVAAFLRQRGAQHAAALLEHEVHDFGRDLLRRDDEVAFVLAVLVVHDDNGFADAEVLDDLLHAIEHSLFCHFV